MSIFPALYQAYVWLMLLEGLGVLWPDVVTAKLQMGRFILSIRKA